MNSIENLPLFIERNNVKYSLCVFVTAWDKLCVAYHNCFDYTDKYCSVVVEKDYKPAQPDNENSRIGNAQTIDDAVKMIAEFISNN